MRSSKGRQTLYPSSFLPPRPRTGPPVRLADLFRDSAGYILVGAIALTAWLFLHIYDRGICR